MRGGVRGCWYNIVSVVAVFFDDRMVSSTLIIFNNIYCFSSRGFFCISFVEIFGEVTSLFGNSVW